MADRRIRQFDGPFSENFLKSPQFFVKKTDKNLIEIVGAFPIGKVKIGFRTYDNNAAQGNKNKQWIDFYLDICEFELLCHNLLSGNIIKRLDKGDFVTPIYKGSPRDGQTYSRVLAFTKANNGIFITAHEGPGTVNGTGAVQPAYDLKGNDHNKVSAMLNKEQAKSFALMGLHACNFYFDHYFGRFRDEAPQAPKDPGYSDSEF